MSTYLILEFHTRVIAVPVSSKNQLHITSSKCTLHFSIPFEATNRSHWLLWISMPHWRLPGAIEMDELVVWDGGLGFLVGNGWVNCFTKARFCRVLDGRDYKIYVFFMGLTSMTCQSLMQVIYMSDSEDEELEASLVLQVIPELEPLKNRGTRFQQEFCMFPTCSLGFFVWLWSITNFSLKWWAPWCHWRRDDVWGKLPATWAPQWLDKLILQELYDVNFGGFLKALHCHMGGSRGD